jgi:hypothetical protein
VNIAIKGTTTGTATDATGKQVLTVSPGSVLAYHFIGFTTREPEVGNKARIDVQLDEEVHSLSKVILSNHPGFGMGIAKGKAPFSCGPAMPPA